MQRHCTQLAATALGTAAIAIALLLHAPHVTSTPSTWTGVQLAFVSAWVVSLLALAWIGAASAIAFVALVSRNRVAAALTRAYAPRFVRRIVEASLVATLLVAPARAAVAAPASPANPAVVAPAGDQPVVRAPAPPATRHPVTPPVPTPAPTAAATARVHVVIPGDNLWSIARAELVARGHANPDTETTERYWLAVIERNRDAIRSHDPNLIYPGESIALPDPG